jgi:hypothetical protein
MEKLYSYRFWFNCYEDLWYAIPSDQYQRFFSGFLEYEGVIKSPKIETLIWMINNPYEVEG